MTSNHIPPKHRNDFHVAIICALPLEADAVEAHFDQFWDEDGDRYGKAPGDQNAYRTGTIGSHNVVLAYMPDIGKGRAASVAANLRSNFQNIRVTAIVGVCGGVPRGVEKGIFLGDIIISDGIVFYEFGRKLPNGFYPKEAALGCNAAVNNEIRAFLHKLKSQKGRGSLIRKKNYHLGTLQNRTNDYQRPAQKTDRLFQSDYPHRHPDASNCRKCKLGKFCKRASEATCEAIECDPQSLVIRSRSPRSGFDIHFGRIASGDTVMKCGKDRDKISNEDDIIAFEMEGAGVSGNLPCLVIKVVCDYADSHKNKQWQKYAAGAAAACMRSLLEQWPTTDLYQAMSGGLSDKAHSMQSASCCADSDAQSIKVATIVSTATDARNEKRNNSWEQESKQADDNEAGGMPEVLSTIKSSFKAVLSCLRRKCKRLPRSSDFRIILKTQRTVFLNNMDIWQSSYNSGDNREACHWVAESLNLALAIQKELKEIHEVANRPPLDITPMIKFPLNLDSLLAPAHTSSTSASTTGSDTVTSTIHRLEDALEDLRSLMQSFTDSMTPKRDYVQVPSMSETTERNRCSTRVPECQHFHVVQEAANSLYDAFKTACRAHPVHSVYLSLQPDLREVKNRVKFNIALVPDSMTGKRTWINVESAVKSSGSCTTPGHYPPYSPALLDYGGKRSKLHDEESSEDMACSGNMQVQGSAQPRGSLFSKQSISIPDLSLQRNLCTIVQRSLDRPEDGTCIGILGDGQTYTHLAYMDFQVDFNRVTTTHAPLSQLVSSSRSDPTISMGLYERVRLARYLATAFLYYHVTPWLDQSWSSDDVQIFVTQHPFIRETKDTLPFITASIQGSSSGKSPDTNPSSSDHSHFIRNPVLFRLGVMLLELAYQAPLASLQQPEDQQKGEKYGFTDYFTACRLAEKSNSVTGSQNFKRIVKKCLHCDFGHDSDFKNTALQEAFCHDVITGPAGLERLEGKVQEIDG